MLHFNLRVIKPGERYGLRDCLVHQGEPLVEFYDARFQGAAHGPFGQFVSRYYVSTFLAINGEGLNLHGGVPEWQMSLSQVAAAQATVRAFMERSNKT